MNVKPLGNQVIIKQAEAKTQTESGLLIAETAQEKPQRGEVIAVGEGKWDMYGEKRIPIDIAPGDQILYNKYAAVEIDIEDNKYIILDAESVYLVIGQE